MTDMNKVFEDYESLLKRIGENLARVRMARGMTQRELAHAMGKNQSIVAKVEKFPSRDITFRCIYEVCRALPVAMGDIVTEAEKQLEFYDLARSPSNVSERMKNITTRLNSLPEEEQVWMTDIIDRLLTRTRPPENFTRRTDRTHFGL